MLGIDIGYVLIAGGNEIFTDKFLSAPAVPGAFETVRELVEKRFGANVHLVSKCSYNMQRKTREWLKDHRFYELTGVSQDHVWFCYERYQKDGICQRLGITHFIDDRLEILGSLTTVGNLYLFQPRTREVQQFAQYLIKVKQVNSWAEIARELLYSAR